MSKCCEKTSCKKDFCKNAKKDNCPPKADECCPPKTDMKCFPQKKAANDKPHCGFGETK